MRTLFLLGLSLGLVSCGPFSQNEPRVDSPFVLEKGAAPLFQPDCARCPLDLGHRESQLTHRIQDRAATL